MGLERRRFLVGTLPTPEKDESKSPRSAQEGVLVSHYAHILGLSRLERLALREAALDDGTGGWALGGHHLDDGEVGQLEPATVLSTEDHLVGG